jgi:shikimate 5-dehydrogenase
VISVPRRGVAIGDSTDGAGFIAALRRAEPGRVGTAVVLGTGGAARAVSAALTADGTRVTVSGRNGAAGSRLASDLAGVTFVGIDRVADAVGAADVVVNATPVGGSGRTRSDPLPEGVALPAAAIAFDLVYRPRRTAFLRRATRAGCRSVEGIEMLIEQGARSFELWTGLDAPIDAMRAAAYRALEADEHPAPAASTGRA